MSSSSSRLSKGGAFDYKAYEKDAGKAEPALFKHAPGIVTRLELSSLTKLNSAFTMAGQGQPLHLIDGRGRTICKIYPADTLMPEPAYSRFMNNMMLHLSHFVKIMGNDKVTEIMRKGANLEKIDETPLIRVAYFTGKDFVPPNP